jgi:hypothetical protein
LLISVIAAIPATAAKAVTVANVATKALAAKAATEVVLVTVASIATKALVKITQFTFQNHQLKLALFETQSKS